VTLEGQIVERMPMEGPGPVPTLLPVKFLAISPGASCVQHGDATGPPVATVLGTALQTRDPQELQYLIVQRLLDRYVKEQRITVSPDEIASYLAGKQRFMAEDRQRREARRLELRAQLQADTAGSKARNALASELGVLDSLAEMENQESAADTSEVRIYAEQVARSFILRYKINRRLYLQYGGRIVFQQVGPEPLDAYRAFLEEQAGKGHFKIFEPELEREFWLYFLTDELHDFYPPGSVEEIHAFDRMFPGGSEPQAENQSR
jgi:hypothetical protein